MITSTPTKKRTIESSSRIRSIVFNLCFFGSIILLHITQLLVFPFVQIFHSPSYYSYLHSQLTTTTSTSSSPPPQNLNHHLNLSRPSGFDRLRLLRLYYNSLARKTFAIVLILVTQLFAPTQLVLSSDDPTLDLERIVHRDVDQNVFKIDLPSHSVIMANHQIYADWLYIWSLAYLADIHSALIIILKASLKWVPLVGPAMQMFSFIFLNRSWASDKADLADQLNQLADQTCQPKIESINKIALLIFPEGTLVSPLTRPLSKKYADKRGLDDLRHCLLPRSTGSLFCMRALSRKNIPNLNLIDLTIGYPGIPPDGYGQDYYTLQSIFGHGQPPPKVHIHIKIIPISEIPIGDLDRRPTSTRDHEKKPSFNPSSSPSSASSSSSVGTVEDGKEEDARRRRRSASSPRGSKKDDTSPASLDPTPEEVERFDRWLRDLWTEKDAKLDYFYHHGHFPSHPHHSKDDEEDDRRPRPDQDPLGSSSSPPAAAKRFESQIRIKHPWDILRTFALTLPGLWLLLFGFFRVPSLPSLSLPLSFLGRFFSPNSSSTYS